MPAGPRRPGPEPGPPRRQHDPRPQKLQPPRCRGVARATRAAHLQPGAALKISHQFPASIDAGDFRDRLCQKFGAEVEKRTNGALKFQVYPGASLMKVDSQFSALHKGALDLGLVPLRKWPASRCC
jgi:TRAP-type C4-dicarboxylate transport system substrate-binding protein